MTERTGLSMTALGRGTATSPNWQIGGSRHLSALHLALKALPPKSHHLPLQGSQPVSLAAAGDPSLIPCPVYDPLTQACVDPLNARLKALEIALGLKPHHAAANWTAKTVQIHCPGDSIKENHPKTMTPRSIHETAGSAPASARDNRAAAQQGA
jgi:hypothetical protein